LPITVSRRLLTCTPLSSGADIFVSGQVRSYNRYIEGRSKLILTVFAHELSAPAGDIALSNEVHLDGYICRPPMYRTTPFGREITDMLIAVNRQYHKSDYIPSIAWGRNARFAASLPVGTHVIVKGRMQSRDYQKRISEEDFITKTAYEISVSQIELPEARWNE